MWLNVLFWSVISLFSRVGVAQRGEAPMVHGRLRRVPLPGGWAGAARDVIYPLRALRVMMIAGQGGQCRPLYAADG